MKLWGGRFNQPIDSKTWNLNKSIDFDQRLALQDVRASMAWAKALLSAQALTREEHQNIKDGLHEIYIEFATHSFVLHESDEDIHTAVERRLTTLIGSIAGKLHTGRSRNDQVATDFRLWLMENLDNLEKEIKYFQNVLLQRAKTDLGVIMPGYTHLQRAQPILLSHWWLSYFWPLERDRLRLREIREHAASLPLGCGALAGTPFFINREELAADLGFSFAAENSLDAVSDRDFVAEFLFCASLIGIHLSKLSENLILFSSSEFRFIEFSDAFTTGSSLMPQKKNPDVFELVRGKTGTLIGNLMNVMTMLKALPSTYDKDLQEDKQPVFVTYDLLLKILPVIGAALSTLTIHPETMNQAIDASMLATDLADYLVNKGVPFRKAHQLTGEVVQLSNEKNIPVDQLSLEDYQHIFPEFGNDLFKVFNPIESINRRNSKGGTAISSVKDQLNLAQAKLHTYY
jgi:argininosuccinate lyase